MVAGGASGRSCGALVDECYVVPGKSRVDHSTGVLAGIVEHHLMSVILFRAAAVPIWLCGWPVLHKVHS
jgi:hypothetical protein